MKRNVSAMLAMTLLSPTLAWSACDATSGPNTAALVELYTSEGCSSCPPADRRLSEFPRSRVGDAKAVPLSLHVDYWDYIGWKEPFARHEFSERQSWLVHANRHETVFTPHFFVSGIEVRDWRGGLAREIERVAAQPARASVDVHARSAGGSVSIAASASAPHGSDRERLALFVAVTEDALKSKITAGENRGVMLTHDHVVREWIGPVALRDGRADVSRSIAAHADWNAAQLGVAAFVQDLDTGRVLQATGASQCLGS